MKSLIISTAHQLLIRMIESTRVWYGACSARGSENLNAIIHLENLISIRDKVGCECVDWVYLAQDRVRLLADRVLQAADHFFTSKTTRSRYEGPCFIELDYEGAGFVYARKVSRFDDKQFVKSRGTNPVTENSLLKNEVYCVLFAERVTWSAGLVKERVVMFCSGWWIHLSHPPHISATRCTQPSAWPRNITNIFPIESATPDSCKHLFIHIFTNTNAYFVKGVNPCCLSNISQLLLLLKTRSGSRGHLIIQEKDKVVLRRAPLDFLPNTYNEMSAQILAVSLHLQAW